MPTFDLLINGIVECQVRGYTTVEADSEEEAIEMAREEVEQGNVDWLDMNQMHDVPDELSFTILEEQ